MGMRGAANALLLPPLSGLPDGMAAPTPLWMPPVRRVTAAAAAVNDKMARDSARQ